MNYTIEEKVQNGQEFLDRVCPGWETKINTDALDVFIVSACVLTHVFGSFGQGVRAMEQEVHSSSSNGFFTQSRYEGRLLTEEWKKVIGTKRASNLIPQK